MSVKACLMLCVITDFRIEMYFIIFAYKMRDKCENKYL